MSDGNGSSADDETEQPDEETADTSTEDAPETTNADEPDAETGDDETADESTEGGDETDENGEVDTENTPDVTPDSLDSRLDDIETAVEDAETETDLDEVERRLDDVDADIEAADLPEPDDEDEDEDAANPRKELESRVTELREAMEEQRGPYADDAVETIEGARSTVADTRWTERGESEVAAAVESFLDSVGELDEAFAVGSDETDELAAALDDVAETIDERDLDPDDDTEMVAGLCEAADELVADLDDAEAWDDLSVRAKLDSEGFYDVLTPETRKDFPPEWNAIKIYEKQNRPEPILRGLDTFGSEFMEGHCIESLKRLGSPEAYDAMEARAQKRNKPPIEALGKIGDARALDTLHDYIEGESDPALQKVTIKAIGEIGSTDSTQAVADRLVADNDTVRSNAARALGLIGDTRAIDPLSDLLSDDDSNPVRASAAWALNQIGTAEALDAAREHANDRSFLVQTEAEKADDAMADDTDAEDVTGTPA